MKKITAAMAISAVIGIACARNAMADPADLTLTPSPGATPSSISGDGRDAAHVARTLGETAQPKRGPMELLVAHGITLLANYTGEAAANPVGGVRQGADYAGQVLLGADFDMSKIAGIEGASMHFAMTERHGKNLAADAIGNNTSVQEIYGGGQNIRLTRFTWEQHLLQDRVVLEAGRTVANIDFLNNPIYCNFQTNSACGNPTFVFKDSNFTYWPVASWAAHFKVFFTPKVYLHAGAYEVDPTQAYSDNHGFDWGLKHATGAIMPFELGYATSFANDRLPRHYQIGGWYDDSDYADPFLDKYNGAQTVTGLSAMQRHGRSGGFVRFDQMIWRPNDQSQRGLTAFGVAMFKVSGALYEDHFLEVGLLQTGTFPGRDLDTIGFVINDQRLSNAALDGVRAARLAQGAGTGGIPHDEVMMELAYGAQVTPAIRVSPNLQYIVSPDQTNLPRRRIAIPDAFVVGLKFSVDLPALFARGG